MHFFVLMSTITKLWWFEVVKFYMFIASFWVWGFLKTDSSVPFIDILESNKNDVLQHNRDILKDQLCF